MKIKNDQLKPILIPQIVTIRKYDIDIEQLKRILRIHKKESGLSNREISLILDIPLTQVEHYFRTDKFFAIPEPDIWLDLAELLDIHDEELNKKIMTFEQKEGVFDKSERHYLSSGISPTIVTMNNDKIIKENNMNTNNDSSIEKYRIRKLTPKECFRLMNFDDIDFYEAESVNSNTRLYSQAGNSIVVSCLAAIFSQLNIKNITPWNNMTLEEQYELTKINISENPKYEQDLI